MTTLELSRELAHVCRMFGVLPREMRYGRTAGHRTGRLVIAARAQFILRCWRRGATRQQLAAALELSRPAIWRWLRELHQRGLIDIPSEVQRAAAARAQADCDASPTGCQEAAESSEKDKTNGAPPHARTRGAA